MCPCRNPCGDYVARFHLGHSVCDHSFQVQELQPNPFEVTVRAKPEYAAGEKVEIPVSARYYFGQPLSRARVKWSMEMEESGFKPRGLRGLQFSSRVGRLASGLFRRGANLQFLELPHQPRNAVEQRGAWPAPG